MFTLDIPFILKHMRPGEKWVVRGDHKDYANLEWLDASAKPTEAEMLTAELAAAKAWRIEKSKQEAQDLIYAQYPIWKQANAAMGLYSAAENQAIKDGIQVHRSNQDAAENTINSLTTVADVIAFTW